MVDDNGEVHVVVEEHEHVADPENTGEPEPIGIRTGDNYEFKKNCVVIDEGDNEHHIPYERIVYAEVPGSFPD